MTKEDHLYDNYKNPRELYEARIASGELKRDAYQSTIIDDLQRLHDELQDYTPEPAPDPGFFSKVYTQALAIVAKI